MRKEALSKVKNFTNINDLPKFESSENKPMVSNFESEEILINPLDYFFSNSVSRSSKTMSECRQISLKTKKTGTNN